MLHNILTFELFKDCFNINTFKKWSIIQLLNKSFYIKVKGNYFYHEQYVIFFLLF